MSSCGVNNKARLRELRLDSLFDDAVSRAEDIFVE
jgi:hypothetical protein